MKNVVAVMSVQFSQLSSSQKKVVEHKSRKLLVLAGPGTGKTEVLTHRILYLINKKNVGPDEITAITFSRKAANEMSERLSKALGLEKEELHVSTLHAESLRLLKKMGRGPRFLVADGEAKLLIRDATEDLGYTLTARELKSLESKIDLFKANNQLPNDVKAGFARDVYERYEELLEFNGAIDLNGLVLRVVRALSSGDANSFSNNAGQEGNLLVDEYQDINRAEYELIKILAEGATSFLVVGDDDQSIYGWRGADPDLIRNFEQCFPNCQTELLKESFRCPGHILKGAYGVVSKDPNCIQKPLRSPKGNGPPIYILASKSWSVEALWITDWIKEYLSKDKTKPTDIVVLTKTLNLAEFLFGQLRREKIKATYWRSGGVLSDKNVLDILAHIRLILDKEDNLALRRCMKTPTGHGIGVTAERKLRRLAEKNKCSLWKIMTNSQEFDQLRRWTKSLASFVSGITEMEDESSKLELVQIVQFIARELGTQRLSNVEKLKVFAKSVSKDCDLNSFLRELNKHRSMDLAGGGPEPETEEEAVAIMSMHSAKGLGYKVVFILGMDNKIMPDLNQDENEQRRLCYVAMTRAKENLFLCHAKARKGPAAKGLSFYKPSKFLWDIPKKHVKVINNEYFR